MKIDFNVFDSVLYGDLRPWLAENFQTDKFQSKITPAFCCKNGSVQSCEKAIHSALKTLAPNMKTDNPIYEIEDSKIVFNTNDDHITGPLIEMEYQPYFNTKTEFYYYMIKNFTTSQVRNLYLMVNFSNADGVDRYIVNSAYTKVKSLLGELPEFILKYGYEDEMPFDQAADDADRMIRRDTDFILKTIRTNLIRAIFEIQELFSNLLDTPVLTEDEVYSQLASLTSPSQKLVKDITLLNEFLVKRFITQKTYSKKDAVFRINYTKDCYNRYKEIPVSAKDVVSRKELLTTHIRALENLIYVREFTDLSVNPAYDTLISDEYMEEIRKTATIALQQELNNIKKPVDKIDFINGRLELLSFFNSGVSFVESDYKPSIPRKIIKWLATQEAYIRENLHIDPALLDTEQRPKIKTNFTVHQLAYFFSLMDKVGLFDMSNKSELCRAVVASFESKKQSDIDLDSFQSKFYNLDINTIEFCHPKIKKMQEFAFADKKNFGA